MATANKQQQGDPLEKLYKVVSDPELGLYSKSFEEFKEQYSTEEQVGKMYSIVSSPELQLYSKDFDSFKAQYFPNLGKESEVSGQGSQNTSETFTEPVQPSQNVREVEQLAPDRVLVSEATQEDYSLAEQGLRRVLVDIPVVGLGDSGQTRQGEFIVPESALTLEPTLTEVNTDGKIDFVLKYTDVDGNEQIISERIPEVVTDKGVGSDLYNSLLAGVSRFNEMIFSIPEFAFQVAAVPQNLIADAIENNAGEGTADWLRYTSEDYDYISQGEYNPLGILSRLADQSRQDAEDFNNQITQFENDIIGSLGDGNYADAGRQVANALVQSAPSMLLMAMSGGAGATAGLGNVGRSTVMAIPFASGAFQETDESTPENVRVLYSLAKGFNEVIFEESFGTLPILRQLGAKVLSKPAMKEVTEGYMKQILSKNGIPASIMKGALSEMATELSNEIVDVYGLGTKDEIDWRNVLNAGVVGSVADGSLSTLNSAIPDRSKRARATELQTQISAIMQDIDNATSDIQSEVLENTLDRKVEELDSIVEESVDLPNPLKDELTEIASQEQEIELMLQSENISEESKVALQEQLNNLDNQKQQILNTNNEQQTEPDTTQEASEVSVESGEVASVQETQGQTQELVETDVTPDTEISTALSTPTFFETISNSDARKARLSELRQSLKDSFSQDQNLGVANDPRTQAERDVQFLRDLTELAILTIADGTVTSVEALKNLVGDIGEISEGIVEKAFYTAREVAQSYVDTNSNRTDEAIGDVFTRMQDVTRTRGTSRVTSSQVRQLTSGGTTGRVSMTTRQALANQMRTLNRGARDMARNVRELSGTISAYIDSQKERFKGVKFTSAELRSVARQVSGIVNEARLEKALDIVDRALDNAEFRGKLASITGLQNRAKRVSKSKKFPKQTGNVIRQFASINPRNLDDVAQIEQYHQMLEDLSKLGVKPSSVSVQAMQQMIDVANANEEISRQERADRRAEKESDPAWQEEQIAKKTKELSDLGFTAEQIDDLLDPTKPFDEVMQSLEVAMTAMKQTRKDVIRKTANDLLKYIKDNVEQIYQGMSSTDARVLREFLDVLNIDLFPDNQLMGLNYVLNNILNNNDIQGIGRFKASAIAQQKAGDVNLRTRALGNLRKIGEWADNLRKKFYATLDIRREALFKDTRLAGVVDNFFGFQSYESGMLTVKRNIRELQQGVDKIIRKHTKGNKNYWQNSYENAMAGVYAIVSQYRSSWTPEQIQENYTGRIKAVVESLDRLRNERALTGRTAYDPTIKVLEQVVEAIAEYTRDADGNIETVTPKMTLEQLWNQLGEGHKEYYNFARDFFEANKEEFFTVTRMFGNEVIEGDWVNYFPMSYLDYTKTETFGGGARADVDLTEVINGFHLRSTTQNLSGAGTARTIEGEMLPRNKIFNFDLLGNFEREAGKMLADIHTLEDKWVLNNMTDIRNNGLIGTPTEPAGFEVQTALTYRQLVAERIEADQNFLNMGGRPQERSALAVWTRVMGTVGVIRALGGYAQWVKQSTPLIETFHRVKNKRSLLLAFKIRAGFNTGDIDVTDLMSRANVQLRADQESLFNLPNKTRSINAEVEKSLRGLAKDMGVKYEDFLTNSPLGKFSLAPLVNSDKYYAEVGWLALYIDNVTDGGNKKLDLTEINENAVSYANLTNNVVMNTSDMSNQGGYAESWLRLFQPMLGFSINSAHGLLIAGSKLRDAVRNGDRVAIKRYSAEVLGNYANVLSFGAISWGVRGAGILAGKFVFETLVKATEDDEDRKKEILESIDDMFEKRLLLNDARSVNYVLTDLATRGVFSDAVTPLSGYLTEKIGVQQFLFGEEELREAGYNYRPFSSSNPNPFINALETYAPVMGVQGMGLTATIGTATNIMDAFQGHEDFIKRTRGFSDYAGKNILVEYADLTPEGIDKFGMPKYMQYSNYLNALMATGTLFGLSDQTVSSMVRNSKSAIRQIVKEDRGLVRTGEWEEREKRARTSFNEIEVGGLKIELTADEQRKYQEQYLQEAVKFVNKNPNLGNRLTMKEYHDVVSEIARGKTVSTIIRDFKSAIPDKAEASAREQLEEARWRQRTVELNKQIKKQD